MKLIIAEKPSLARNIAAGIGTMRRRDGYLENEEYLITWAFGHLFSLCDIESYAPSRSGRWEMDNLPCFPETFRFELKKGTDKQPDAGVEKQFSIIKTLANRADVDALINAGDADREGEIIIRLCIQNALASEKPIYRLWLPDQTPRTVAQALREMKPQEAYQHLADEGFARTYMDWLYGVNLTRYATLRTGVLLRVGRVIVPIVKAIYDRDKQIENFTPTPYFAIASKCETGGEMIELVSKLKFSENEQQKALDTCVKYNSCTAIVTSVKSRKTTLSAGKLFSLSKLQNYLGKKYKMSMEKSLAIVQKLYEAGYVTYPRTNSEYLATNEKEKIKGVLAAVAKLGYPVTFKDNKTIFDDSKIESHSALTPTYKIPTHLADEEKQVYSAIIRRFTAVFCSEECTARKTEIEIAVGEEETFLLRGTVILQPGWTKFDDTAKKSKILPALSKGDTVNIDFKPLEKQTAPPKHYTIETLNNYLKNPFKDDKKSAQNDEAEYRAMFEGLELGTEATRTGIIDNACKSQYILLKKDVYTLLPGGEYLITTLSQLGISMDKYKTSLLGQSLKKVYHGTLDISESLKLVKKEISDVFTPKKQPPETDTDIGFYGEEIGVCPLCGKTVKRGSYGYFCTGYKDGCKFKIRLSLCGRVISLSNAKRLLSDGKSAKIQGFISKKGTPFDAILKLEDGKIEFDF